MTTKIIQKRKNIPVEHIFEQVDPPNSPPANGLLMRRIIIARKASQ